MEKTAVAFRPAFSWDKKSKSCYAAGKGEGCYRDRAGMEEDVHKLYHFPKHSSAIVSARVKSNLHCESKKTITQTSAQMFTA